MNKTLIILILAVIVLSWNFVFTDSKKIELTDPAKVLKSLSLAIKYKKAVNEYWQAKGSLPETEEWQETEQDIEVDISRSLVKNIVVGTDGAGVISVYFINKDTIKVEKEIDGGKIMLIPRIKGERLIWTCKGTLQKEYLPSKCQ
tara:strand:- start:1883 stop:2317 length:435 start_codon:yes stop_codon:yes gene_type:complete